MLSRIYHLLVLTGFLISGLLTTQSQAVLISEIMYHPTSTNVLEEYVELNNSGSTAINLTGWQFTKGVQFTFPTNTVLTPGAHLVVAADASAFSVKHPEVTNFVAGWTGRLRDDGETILLADSNGQTVDEVVYAPEGDWAERRLIGPDQYDKMSWEWFAEHDGLGKSLELINPALPNSLAHNWASSLTVEGTPGRANSVAQTNIAPLVVEVGHRPLVPRSTDQVIIHARIVDEYAGGITATLSYRIDGEPAFTSAPMFDDGAHSDGLANDGLFGFKLTAQPHGTMVEFYVTASDSEGQTRVYPAVQSTQNGRTANLLYQVSDEVLTGDQPLYRLIIPRSEYAYLQGIWTDAPRSDALVNGAFVSSDGTVSGGLSTEGRYSVGFRNRGNGSRQYVPHNFRVSLPKDRPWDDRSDLNLNTQFTQTQVFGSALMRRLRLTISESQAARVRVSNTNLANSGSPQFGVYAANEIVDSALIERQIPDNAGGNLYRGIHNAVPGNPTANLTWHGSAYQSYTNAYYKRSNQDENDWSDLIRLLDVLNNTAEDGYIEAIHSVINVEQWMRYFAVNTLTGNRETALGTGYGDDYVLYRGQTDQRFLILPYDLDSIFGQGTRTTSYADGIFRMVGTGTRFMPALDRLVKHPQFAPLYYRELNQLAQAEFDPAQMDLLLEQFKQWFPPGTLLDAAIENMKAFNASHVAYVKSQIPLALTIESTLSVTNGYVQSTNAVISLNGRAHAVETRSVLVNGVAVNWSAWEARWSVTNVVLQPGINRVLVQSLNDAGGELERTHWDVWYDDGSMTSVGGVIAADATWLASDGPYFVTSNLTVANGVTLTIEPGTTIYLASGIDISVANGARLLAEGTAAAPIRFTRMPGTSANWGGITINGSVGSPETRITHALIEFNGDTAIHSVGGTVFLDHLVFGNTAEQYVSLDESSFIVSHCYFPSATAAFELAHGDDGIKSGGRGLFLRNYFGSTIGYNDVIDFTGGNRPGPIVQFIENVFLGSDDDILDLDGTDAWVEGNIFLHVHRNGSPDSASGVSGGSGGGTTSRVTIIGNIFYDCDQAVTAKQGNYYTMINNTIVHQTLEGGLDTDAAVANFADDGTTEGLGMYLEGNILYDVEKLVRNHTAANVVFTNNLLSLEWNGAGGGNSSQDPLLLYLPKLAETFFTDWQSAQVMREWFSLRPGSPAIATGPNGSDRGGVIPLGVSLATVLTATNSATEAVFQVGSLRSGMGIPSSGWPNGSGYTHYRWRLNEGAWSEETPTEQPISLSGLTNGQYVIEVAGKRDSDSYQDDPALADVAVVTRSRSWVVDTNYVAPVSLGLRLNEVLAKNIRTFTNGTANPDLIELYNGSDQPIDLGGISLSDNILVPRKFTFASGTMIAPGGYLVLLADSNFASPGIHLGFALDQDGDSVWLHDSVSRGGALLDGVSFGMQVSDYSLGRLADGSWVLCQPTFGNANRAQRLGDFHKLKINEWLANALFLSANDFVELFNPEPVPVALGGLYLSDASGTPDRHEIAPLSFIPAAGWVTLIADGDEAAGANHLGFKLAAETGIILLSAPDVSPLDSVTYSAQRMDISQGRTPDGAVTLAYFQQPTPGTANPVFDTTGTTNVTYVRTTLIDYASTWKYQADGADLGAAWMTTNYDDTNWLTGQGLFGLDTSTPYPYPLPVTTPLSLTGTNGARIRTYYFRTTIELGTNVAGLQLEGTNYLDDGAVYYLNGVRVGAIRVADDPATYSSSASSQSDEGEAERVSLSTTNLVPGVNVLAVEVHQAGSNSSDVMFGLTLQAVQAITNIVLSERTAVELSEVLVSNQTLPTSFGRICGWVEFHNYSTNFVSLADLSLTDDPAMPRKWIFPSDANIQPLGFTTIALDGTRLPSGTNTGFSLSKNGGGLILYDNLAKGGAQLDIVTFGLQAVDFAIGRVVQDALSPWGLTVPTESAENLPAGLGSPTALRLNEWMADPITGADWFELYNGDSAPVALAGLSFTDDFDDRIKSPIAPLSFIGVGHNAYVQFFADSSPESGADHVDFKLSKESSPLGLFTLSGIQLDALSFGAQSEGVSQGRLPDGAVTLVSFPLTPTPGAANSITMVELDTDGDGMPDAWEDLHELDRFTNDAGLDADADGLANGHEYIAGTDPQAASSSLNLTLSLTDDSGVALQFTAIAGKTYTLQATDELVTGNWEKLIDVPAGTTNQVIVIEDPRFTGARYYRLVTPMTP